MNQQNKEGVKPGGVKPGVVSLLLQKKRVKIRKKEEKEKK